MKRVAVLIIVAYVLPIGVLKAVDCAWDEQMEHDFGCDCGYIYCYGTGSLTVTYDCPSNGDCPACEFCFVKMGREPYWGLVYAEPDCFTQDYPCTDPEQDCYVEGYDQSSMVWEDTGYCECWD